MSEVKQTKCDGCQKTRCDDPYKEVGWVKTSGTVSITKGSDGNGQARSRYASSADRDFCSLHCYVGWLKALK